MKRKSALCFFVTLLIVAFIAAVGLILAPQSVLTANAYYGTVNTSTLDSDHTYLSKEYQDVYQLKPNTHFTYKSSHPSYGGYELAKAFDGNFNTAYICMKAVDSTTYPNIEVNFKQTATIDRIIYKCKDYDGKASGFPNELKLWYWNGNSSDSVTVETYPETSDIVMFKFSEPITATRIRFDFVSVSVTNNSVSNSFAVPTAAEIMILQPENNYVDIVGDLFADYRWTKLNPKYATKEMIALLRKELSGHANYQTAYLPRIERAEALLNGTAEYIPDREYATDDETLHKIYQYGNIINYARQTLKMDYAGTNRQPTGIYQNAGQTITVWVDADDGVPLPGITLVQYLNYCYDYQQSYTLSRGRNVITVPDFVHATSFTYTRHTVSGGTVHITNPYTPAQQQGGVKVYIEGGYTYPVMSYNTTSAEYLAELSKYGELVKAHPDEIADVTELVSNHTIVTIPASSAYNVYASTRDPLDVLKSWDSTVEDILTFEGIALEAGGDHYDERVQHLNFNVRYAQPMGNYAAYAFPEIIGLVDFLPAAIQATTFGWGIPHEIGHLFDISDRKLSETTNNVIAKYYEVNHNSGNHNSFATIRNSLASDLADTSMFWTNHRGCFDFWWAMESVFPGFWAKFENCYRYETRYGLTNTEVQVYFASLATGHDMSYYFERWGFWHATGIPFNYENSSANFKSVMQQAKSAGKFDDAQYKIWYANNDTYKYVAINKGASIYTKADKPSISSVVKVGGGYKIILPASSNSAHYGYEIWQGNDTDGYNVIGFTEGDSYIDATPYENGYVPSYKIVAYDKTLESSSLSDAAVTEESASPVCRLNGLTYGSLQQAVYAANAGDVIYLLDDVWEYDISIAINLTITIAESVSKDITITKGNNGVLFDVRSGARLILQGSAAHKLIFDGNSYGGGPLINVNGATLNASYVKFMNCKSSYEGGAIAAYGGTLTLENCDFENCVASDGSAIYADSATVTITSCKFESCHAEEGNASGYARGGAIYLMDCGSKKVTITSTTISDCSAQGNGGQSISNGGAIYIENCTNVIIDGTDFSDCDANYGGAIYLKNANVTIRNSCSIDACSAMDGGAIYVTEASTLAIEGSTLTGNTASNNGGGIYVASADSVLSITGISKLESNKASYGGAIASVGTIAKILGGSSNIEIASNQAQFGGGIAVLNGGRIDSIQSTFIRFNTAEYGGGIYLEGSANLYDSATIGNNTASKIGGAIYYRGDENSQLKFNSFGPSSGARPTLSSNQASIGYEVYMESGNLVMLSVKFNYNYALASVAPTDDEMQYSLYVNSGTVEIAGYAGHRENGASYIEASLEREIYLSHNATVHLTNGMFAISETYLPTNPPVFMQYITEQFLRIALDRYDYDCVKVLFTADFDIPEDALDLISMKNTEYGDIEVRGRTICFVPYNVTLTVDFDGEIETISRLVETGSTYTFTAEGYQSETRYIAGFLVNGVTYKMGESVTIDDATYVKVLIADKYKITLTFRGEEIVLYFSPDETFTFEATCSLVGEETIAFWLYNGERYEVGDTVRFTGDAVLMPILEGMVKVEFYVGDERVDITYVMAQDTLVLPDLPSDHEGYEVYWLVGDERYKAGEEVTITGEVMFVAELVKLKLTVTYLLDNVNGDTLQVDYGTEITLESPDGLPEGRQADYYLVNGVKYEVGDTIIITEATTINLITKAVSGDNQGGDNNQGGGENQGGDNNQGGNENPEVALPGGGSGNNVGCNSGCNRQSVADVAITGGITFLFTGGLWAMLKVIRKKRTNQ